MKRIMVCMFLLMLAGTAFAEFVGAEGEVVDIGRLMVEEEAQEEYSAGSNAFGQSNAVFKEGAIESGEDVNIVDLLEDVPGVYLNKASLLNYTVGSYASSILKIRGLGNTPNNGILTVIDGRPQSMGIWRHPLFDTLPLDMVESVEIIKGPASVEYGNQAVAGVINIMTKKMEKEGFKGSLGVMVGSYSTQDYRADIKGRSERINYAISAGYRSTAGDRVNSDSYQNNYFLRLGYSPDKHWTADISGTYNDITCYNPGPVGDNWVRGMESARTIQRSTDIRVEQNDFDNRGSVMVYSDTGSNDFFIQALPSSVTIPGSDNIYENYGIRAKKEWNIIPGNMIRIGFDWQYYSGHFINYVPDASPYKRDVKDHENNYAPYVMVNQQVGIFSLMMGMRYGFSDLWSGEFIPQAGFKASLYEGHYFYVNASRGYRTPAMGDALMYYNYTDLMPEVFWQYEIGMTHRIKDVVYYTLAGYQIEGDNLLVKSPAPLLTMTNSDGVLIRGVEASIDVSIADFLRIGSSISYSDPNGKTKYFSFFNGRSYIKGDIGKVVTVKLEAEYAKERYDSDYLQDKLDDYFVINAELKYKTMFMGIDADCYMNFDNITNVKYEVISGYPVPGFVVKGGMTLKYN